MIAPSTPDLRAVIEAHLQTLMTERGDEHLCHVSDVFGCDFASWSRRQPGFKPALRDSKACLKMQLGNDIERYVCDALQLHYEAQGYVVRRDYALAWNPKLGQGCAVHARTEEPFPAFADTRDSIFGHVDLFADRGHRIVIECKSTSYLRGKVPDAPQQHYVEQTATYAIALGATQAGIIIVCRESGRIAGPFWLDLDALEAQTIARAKEVIERTNPEAFPPEAQPRYSWQPKYCALGSECQCK